MKFEIENIIENDDGTCNVEYDYDEEYAEFAKQQLMSENGGKEPTTEELEQFFAEAVQKAVDKKREELELESLQQEVIEQEQKS